MYEELLKIKVRGITEEEVFQMSLKFLIEFDEISEKFEIILKYFNLKNQFYFIFKELKALLTDDKGRYIASLTCLLKLYLKGNERETWKDDKMNVFQLLFEVSAEIKLNLNQLAQQGFGFVYNTVFLKLFKNICEFVCVFSRREVMMFLTKLTKKMKKPEEMSLLWSHGFKECLEKLKKSDIYNKKTEKQKKGDVVFTQIEKLLEKFRNEEEFVFENNQHRKTIKIRQFKTTTETDKDEVSKWIINR